MALKSGIEGSSLPSAFTISKPQAMTESCLPVSLGLSLHRRILFQGIRLPHKHLFRMWIRGAN
ncbi:hypothetical protein AMATHDRAFT_70578 [Amanita thiersii Skay4041]|uniref:Uncharacterized protein n=1 Tax=Amanita thiersii Skay4041 TaxID=703135 RepID=A0A2A9NCZ5_9AGAR|nr:hypothetical protein AMATHDRAFT_70578 [Amanita thiersii Skay4041]